MHPHFTFTLCRWSWSDLWRERDENSHSSLLHTLSRIDYTFSNSILLDFVTDPHIHEIAISDDAPISVDLSGFILQKSVRIWQFPLYLACNWDLQKTIRDTWADYVATNSEHMFDPNLFWEAGKAVQHGRIISFATGYKKMSPRNTARRTSLCVMLRQA